MHADVGGRREAKSQVVAIDAKQHHCHLIANHHGLA
jgi:hypothetical protein